MVLSREQIDALLHMLSLTRSQEPTCDECAKQLAEFAENHLAGRSVPDGLEAIEHHLELCGPCREEFLVLLKALED